MFQCVSLHDELLALATPDDSAESSSKDSKDEMFITKDVYGQHRDSWDDLLQSCVAEELHTKNRFMFKSKANLSPFTVACL